jgi:hypothetical protein
VYTRINGAGQPDYDLRGVVDAVYGQRDVAARWEVGRS